MNSIRRAIQRTTILPMTSFTDKDEKKMGTRSSEHRILVVGKSGNGKSSLCNTLCASDRFDTGRGLSVTTRTAQYWDLQRYGLNIRVVDTPDITNLHMSQQEMEEEVARWRQATLPFPTIVLLAVRCDVRYTPEEHAIYREIHRQWGDNSLKDRLVVAFTFGDRQDNDLEEELKTVCPELKTVLRDASNQYVLFNNKGSSEEKERSVQRLLMSLVESPFFGRGRRFRIPRQAIPVLGIICVICGICFAASVTDDNSTMSTVSGILFFGAGTAAVVLKIMEFLK